MKNHKIFPVSVRPIACAVALALAGMGTAQAVEFGDQDGFHAKLDTTVSYGVSWRVSARDPDLIGKANINPLIGLQPFGGQAQRDAPGRFSVNSDDGDRNFEDGDPISNAAKISFDLNLYWGNNTGAFLRGLAFYDFAVQNKDALSDQARRKAGKDAKLLDAFVFHNFQFGEGQQATVRVGRQVVSWGESTFIQNGVNVINPVDVSKLRVAGAELKEAFLPVNMVWGSVNFTENFSAEALYLLEFAQTDPEPAGTFFSTNDFASIGGKYVMLSFGTVPQPVINPDFYYGACFQGRGTDIGNLTTQQLAQSCAVAIPRAPDRYASEHGQGGFALHYLADFLNNTEISGYALNYHSRLPLLSGISVRSTDLRTGRYFAEYPEDIHLFGLAFNTQFDGPGIALQGELSYRPNAPLQFDDVELLFSALSPLNVLIPAPGNRFVSQLGNYGPGQEIRGWERHKLSQLQFTGTKVFGPNNFLGADQIALVSEVGFTNADIPSHGNLRFQGDGTDTGGGPDVTSGSLRNPITQVKGFPTRFSWGYRVAARADYNNAFGGSFTVSPRIAFNHDVQGITPGPGGSFIEGRKSITLGAEANYLNKVSFDVSYTDFFGAGNLNLISDRDFVSFSVKYSF